MHVLGLYSKSAESETPGAGARANWVLSVSPGDALVLRCENAHFLNKRREYEAVVLKRLHITIPWGVLKSGDH